MISRLRRSHLMRQTALAGITAVGVILALNSRPEIPTDALPVSEAESHPLQGETLWQSEAVFSELQATVAVKRAGERFGVEVRPESDPLLPDLLVYWSPESAEELPEKAHFLGRLAGAQARSFPLPGAPGGSLYLYSLGHQQLVDHGAISAGAAR